VHKWFQAALVGFALSGLAGTDTAQAGVGGTLRLEIIDKTTRLPLACRMHLTNAGKRPLKAPRVPYWHDHFVVNGSIELKLPKGEYDFVIERGLEYLTAGGHFTMQDLSKDTQTIELERFADMAAEGWWSGDLDAARPAKDLELLMLADDLHVVELITWPGREVLLPKSAQATAPLVQFDQNRFFHTSAGIDARGGGTLLLFNLEKPLDIGGLRGEYPPQSDTIAKARANDAWIDAREAYGWDVPVWAATGGVDSIQVINSDLRRGGVLARETKGRPRDAQQFSGLSGNARWSEAIYYHLLNCGLRIPPTAGSGSGEVPNPLGYNRLYAHVDGELTYDAWWQAVREGRVVVTNGPLIRPIVEGQLPGHVFQAEAGQRVELEVAANFSTRDQVSYIEVVQDGQVVAQTRIEEFAASGGRLPSVTFDQSGWLLIRAACEVPGTYRYGMTAPYYVEIAGQPRISKKSAQFFLDWIEQRMAKIKLADATQQEAVLKIHRQAEKFWQDMVAKANAP